MIRTQQDERKSVDETLRQADRELRSGVKDVVVFYVLFFHDFLVVALAPSHSCMLKLQCSIPTQDRLSFSSGSAVARGGTP